MAVLESSEDRLRVRCRATAFVLLCCLGGLLTIDSVERATLLRGCQLLVAAGIGALALFDCLEARYRARGVLVRDLELARADVAAWGERVRRNEEGLGVAIDNTFAGWSLTPAEAEVALLLLKGLSHKEAALARDSSERTVRQQARSVYRKAGLSGRACLSAFFLEDLLAPGSPTECGEWTRPIAPSRLELQ